MISLLKTSSLIFERGGGEWNESGEWDDSATSSVPTEGSLQPFRTGTNQVKLPEGITANDARVYFTPTKLLTASQFTKTVADITTIDGLVYEVFDVADWSTFGLLTDNFQCILIRQDLNTGGA